LQLVEGGAAVVAILGGVAALVRFIWKGRLKVAVSGIAQLQNDGYGRMSESFVFHVRSERDHPVKIEVFSIWGQDTHGDFRELMVMNVPLNAPPISKGMPYRVELPFNDLSEFGVDVRRRIYGFARLAQPAKTVWSRRVTGGPQRGALARSLPRPLARPAGQPRTQPPWWVRWFK
jgi:hypothetical protein